MSKKESLKKCLYSERCETFDVIAIHFHCSIQRIETSTYPGLKGCFYYVLQWVSFTKNANSDGDGDVWNSTSLNQ